jgi:hypothetical protein
MNIRASVAFLQEGREVRTISDAPRQLRPITQLRNYGDTLVHFNQAGVYWPVEVAAIGEAGLVDREWVECALLRSLTFL